MQPLGIYLHWPFCLAKCPYCDFNSHVQPAIIDHADWQEAFCREITRLRRAIPDHQVSSIFFGGGTPSLIPPSMTGAIIDLIAKTWPVSENIEITLEANPGTVTLGQLTDFRASGINRLSIGVQSLRDQSLQFLSRIHDAAQAITAITMARNIFPRLSIDLIYALPNQEIADWRSELQEVLDLKLEHLSIYQLTIEEGTPFGKRQLQLPDEECAAEMFELTQIMTEAAGLPAYEISNHSIPGEECRHNLIYWQGNNFIGIGPAAHGRISGMATVQYKSPSQWLSAALSGNADEQQHHLSQTERMEELVMMGLRLRQGIKIPITSLHEEMIADGFLLYQDGYLRASDRGRLVLNSVLGKILGA